MTMATYTLDVLIFQQSNILFIIFAHDLKYTIAYHIIQSNIMIGGELIKPDIKKYAELFFAGTI